MEKAITHDVAGNVSELLYAKVKSVQGTLTIRQVLEGWEEKLRTKPLEQRERILLSNRLFKGGYKDFSFEVMIGTKNIRQLSDCLRGVGYDYSDGGWSQWLRSLHPIHTRPGRLLHKQLLLSVEHSNLPRL